jgi:hypothetical protein
MKKRRKKKSNAPHPAAFQQRENLSLKRHITFPKKLTELSMLSPPLEKNKP